MVSLRQERASNSLRDNLSVFIISLIEEKEKWLNLHITTYSVPVHT